MESDHTTYVPFKDRPEYEDLSPIPQDDGPYPICPITYTPEFTDTLNYFRAIIQKDERSRRALDITKEVIELNAANYTAWYYRRLILESIKADYREELKFVSEMALEHPKNYQIWHHRLVVVEILNDPSNELDFTAEVLTEDAKNYHAWSHRQWVIKKFNFWDKELDYCEKLLTEDIRNNSAWNQRYFVVTHFGLTKETREREIRYSMEKISKSPNNESAWNYLVGLVKGMKFSDFPIIEEFCLEKKSQWITCSFILATLIDCYEESNNTDNFKLAVTHCDTLIKGLDDIHKKYWIWKKDQLLKLLT